MDNPFTTIDKRFTGIEKLLEKIMAKVEPQKPDLEIKYLTREEVADLLRVNVNTVYNLTQRGVLTSYQLSGQGSRRIYYKLNEIEQSMVELKK